MKLKIITLLIIPCLSFLFGCAGLSESGEQYRQSIQAIRDGQNYFAVLYLNEIVKESPQSPYAPSAAFTLGEHYFDTSDDFNAIKVLSDYIHNYPKDKGVVFAKLIIYKIIMASGKEESMNEQQNALIKEIRKELFSQPLFLIFYDKKSPRSYKSLFHNSYLVYDYVDKIKVIRNDKIFLELSP